MSRHTQRVAEQSASDISRAVRKRMIQVILLFLIQAAILFLASGRLNWIWAWLYLGVGLGLLVLNTLILPVPAELIAERGQPKGEAKRWDKVLTTLNILPALCMPIVAGLDERFGWSAELAPAIHLSALILWALGQGLFSWAMVSNKYFSTVVRLQMERGHTVATGGPYRHVRHPGYTGYILSNLATPLALGSLWTLIPAGLSAVILVVRTAREDRFLRDELPGYDAYTQETRYRLLPGIW